ncbi:hypothetical protein IJJ27_01425 [bacterium]|nr:hypothetical protein [bacterium]
MKRILILARDESKAKFQKLQQFLNATDGLQVEVASWRELEFSLESLENATIKFGNTDLKDYDHILVMSYVDVEADVLSAIACYCRHWHVKMSDDHLVFWAASFIQCGACGKWAYQCQALILDQ